MRDTNEGTRVQSVTDRVVASGLLNAIGLDVLGGAALVMIGVSVYRLAPDLVWGYAGVLLLGVWYAVGRSRGAAKARPTD